MIKRAMRSGIKRAVASAFYYTGFIHLWERVRSVLGLSGVRILAYHNVSSHFPPYLALNVPSHLFEEQLEYLRKHYDIISLPEAVEILKEHRKGKRDKFVFTFDDNYREFHTELLPIMSRCGIPFTIFPAVEPLHDGASLFPEALIYAVSCSKREWLDVRSFGLENYPIRTEQEKGEAISAISNYAKGQGGAKERALLNHVLGELGMEAGELGNLSMGWGDVEALVKEGVLIGSHGMTHALLTTLEERELEFEIHESQKCLESRTGETVKYFAYPYGGPDSYNGDVLACVERAGYEAAFVHGKSKVRSMYALDRIGMDASVCSIDGITFFKPLFALEASGLAHYVFLRWLRNCLNGNGASGKQKTSRGVSKARQRIRCLFMIDILWGFAGTEKHLFQIVKGLDRENFDCRVVAFRASNAMIRKYDAEGIPIVNLNLDRMYGVKALFKFVPLVSILRSFRPDIVQTFHFMSDTYGVAAARIAGVSAIVSSRRDMGDRKRPRQVALNRLMNPFIRRFIAVCERVGKQLAEVERIPPNRIYPIPNGVDLGLYEADEKVGARARRSVGIGEDAFVVGIVSILRPEKDIHLFLDAVDAIRNSTENLVALVVGDGPMMVELVAYAHKRNLEDVVTFTGYVDDVRDHVQCMDVVCMTPKENEGLSNAILEEMAMGKAVIATDVGGNAELVVDGQTGFVIDPGDADALADRILALYRDPARREKMGWEARKRVEDLFSLERMIENMEHFYKDLRTKTA